MRNIQLNLGIYEHENIKLSSIRDQCNILNTNTSLVFPH